VFFWCSAALKEKNDLLRKTLDELQALYSAMIEVLLEARLFKKARARKRRHDHEGEGRVSLPYAPRRHEGGDLAGLFPSSKQRYGLYAVEFAGHGVATH
jgi:sigma-B regulation protein RsbU (phosphoserine phosphatase)